MVKNSIVCLLCLALALFGLQGCKSKAALLSDAVPSDNEIEADIRSRIAEAGMPPVRVFVMQKRVVLSGLVPNIATKEKVLAIARSTPDVLSVADDVQVKKIQ
jgi:osmotically-inducible protein OsmY